MLWSALPASIYRFHAALNATVTINKHASFDSRLHDFYLWLASTLATLIATFVNPAREVDTDQQSNFADGLEADLVATCEGRQLRGKSCHPGVGRCWSASLLEAGIGRAPLDWQP